VDAPEACPAPPQAVTPRRWLAFTVGFLLAYGFAQSVR
jgi:hypothetical protein